MPPLIPNKPGWLAFSSSLPLVAFQYLAGPSDSALQPAIPQQVDGCFSSGHFRYSVPEPASGPGPSDVCITSSLIAL